MSDLKVGDKVRVIEVRYSSNLRDLFNSATDKVVVVGDQGVVKESPCDGTEIKVEGWVIRKGSEVHLSFFSDQVEKVKEELRVVAGPIRTGDKVRVTNIDPASFLANLINSETGKKVAVGDVGIVSKAGSVGDVWVKGWKYAGSATETGFMRSQLEKVEDTVSETVEKKAFVKGDRVKVVKVMGGLGMSLGDLGEIYETRSPEDTFLNIKKLSNGNISKGLYASQFAHAGPHDVIKGDKVTLEGNSYPYTVEQISEGGAALISGVWYDPQRLTRVIAEEVVIPAVPEKADIMLRMIDAFFARKDNEAQNLQHVLSALRGPDDAIRGDDVKTKTTSHIRRAALPKTFESCGGWAIGMTFETNGERFDESVGNVHFSGHIQSAARALRDMGRQVG